MSALHTFDLIHIYINIYELQFYIILLYHSEVGELLLLKSACEFFGAEKQKNKTPATSHCPRVVSSCNHCQKSPLLRDAKEKSWKMMAELPATFRATCGLLMQSVETFSTETLWVGETDRNRQERRMHWPVKQSLTGPQNVNFSATFSH